MFRNRKGVSLLYVLMALVCVGAIGTLVLNMAKKEAGDSSLRLSSELARFSSTAGLTYAANWFTKPANKDRILDILKASENWNDEKNKHEWITGAAASNPGSDDRFYEDKDNGMKFRVKIVNIDITELKPVNDDFSNADDSYFTVMLESESIDKSGSRAKNIGFYKITGFEKNKTSSDIPTHAFYLGGGNMWIHCPVTVNGSTYIGNPTNSGNALYHAAGSNMESIFNGEFRLYQADLAPPSQLSYEIFKGPAYFQGGRVIFIRAPINFEKGFGGSAKFYSHQSGINVYNGTAHQKNHAILSWGFEKAGSFQINFMGTDTELHYVNPGQYNLVTNTVGDDAIPSNWTPENFPENFITGSSPSIKLHTTNISDETVLNLLGMDTKEPPAFRIQIDTILKYVNPIKISGQVGSITGSTLQNWYSGTYKNSLYKDKNGKEWLVLETEKTAPTAPFGSGGSGFTGKAVIIYRGGSGWGLPEIASTGNVLFYIPNTDVGTKVDFNQLLGNFRGLVYNGSSNTEFNLSALNSNSWTIRGAFYNSPQNSYGGFVPANKPIQLGAGQAGRITVNYDKDALQELVDLGVIVPPDPDPNGKDDIGKVDGYQGKSTLLSRSF